MGKSNVPETIYFGNQILKIPTLESLYVDSKLKYHGFVSPKFEIGQWVEKNELLLEIKYDTYTRNDKPFLLFKDSTQTETFSLKSPCAGLIVGMQQAEVAFYEQHSAGSTPLLSYNHKRVFPIILMPKDEPPINTTGLSYFYNDINRYLNNNWTLIKFRHSSDGYVRLKEIYSENEIKFLNNAVEIPNPISEIDVSQDYLNYDIQNLRSKYLDLRDKLLHLVKEEKK